MNETLLPFQNFDQACHAVLELLQNQFGFDLWMMTRTLEDEWVVLQAQDKSYQVQEGQVFRWQDSFCSRMVQGEGPNIAPDSDLISAYAQAPIGQQVDIKSYIGLPVYRQDGELFGTLCAIDPNIQPETIREAQPTIELMAKLLGALISKEFELLESKRNCKQALTLAETDKLTNCLNRRGWERATEAATIENKSLGTPVHVFIIDLDNMKKVNDEQGHLAGDALIKRTAELLYTHLADQDVIARLGGDEFGVITFNQSPQEADTWLNQINHLFQESDIVASIGYAKHYPQQEFKETIHQADSIMYKIKKSKNQTY